MAPGNQLKIRQFIAIGAIMLLGYFPAKAQSVLRSDTGIASYYADKFHGRRTASGSLFHQDSLTAAHKTLPFGTRVKVTNLRNNRSVVVTITDRGMKGKNRIIDLSRAAAKKLNMTNGGLVRVKVDVLK